MSEPDQEREIGENIARVRERIAIAEARTGRRTGAVRLLAVTKMVSASGVAAAIRAGVLDIGENYVQEARAKIPLVESEMNGSKTPNWHLIGHLQSNKAKFAVMLFSLIQGVDSFELAKEIDRQAAKLNRVQPILLEVRLSEDELRPGAAREAAMEIAARIAKELPYIALRGLMGVAPAVGDAAAARPHFRALRALWEKLPPENRQELSMGMSGDYEIAVEEGATLIRIGTALFGTRKVN